MRVLSFCLFLLSLPCMGATRVTQKLDAAKFDSLNIQQMDDKSLYYNEKVLPFPDWALQNPQESQALALYPGYEEPQITTVKNGVPKQLTEKIIVFAVRTKIILDKAPGQINLKGLINIDSIRKFDPEIQHIPLQQDQFMSAVAGRSQISNFQWCNKTGPYIVRPSREVELSHINPKSRAWCSDVTRSICVESCYLFGTFWYQGVKVVNLGMDESEKKDYGIALQSEVRYFQNERELGLSVPLNSLTKLNTPVRGGLEQNMFYFNQVIEFGKILAVLQDDPADPNKTVVNTFFVVGVKKRTYNQNSEIKNILLGQSSLGFNTKTGITAGLPVFTQNMVNSIANLFEK